MHLYLSDTHVNVKCMICMMCYLLLHLSLYLMYDLSFASRIITSHLFAPHECSDIEGAPYFIEYVTLAFEAKIGFPFLCTYLGGL